MNTARGLPPLILEKFDGLKKTPKKGHLKPPEAEAERGWDEDVNVRQHATKFDILQSRSICIQMTSGFVDVWITLRSNIHQDFDQNSIRSKPTFDQIPFKFQSNAD